MKWKLSLITCNSLPHSQFRLSYYPHKVKDFTDLLQEVFGEKAEQKVFGDFKPIKDVKEPAFYIHVVTKPLHD